MARLRYIENARVGDAGSVVTNDSKLFFDDTSAYIYASASGTLDLVATTVKITGNLDITGSLSYGSETVSLNQNLLGKLTVGINDSGYDVLFYGAADSAQWLWDANQDTNGGVTMRGTFKVTGAVTITGAATISSTLTMAGATTFNEAVTAGSSGTGYDVKFYGDTAANYMHWDESGDDLLLVGTATQFAVAGTTNAVSATTGSIRTAGGIGIVQDLWVGGLSELVGAVTISDAVGITGAVTITGAVGITGNSIFTGTVGITGATTIATTNKLQFRDADLYLNSSVDGTLNIVADTILALAATNMTMIGILGVTGATTITGATQITGALTVGVSETGHDVQFFGATAGAYMLWDESGDDLILVKSGLTIGATAVGITFNGANATACISMDGATLANGDHEIQMRNTVSGDKTIIAAGTATDDAAIVTAVGSDADIADGSIYLSSTDGGGALFVKINDIWTTVVNA